MSRPSLSDRLASALIGAVFGALIGAAVAYLVDTRVWDPGYPDLQVDYRSWATKGAMAFGLVGLLFGSGVGTVVGVAFDLLFRSGLPEIIKEPMWLVILAIVLTVAYFYYQNVA
jgi:ABC-type branched-subunit amino acid transport system permease subunit